MDRNTVEQALRDVRDEYLGKDLISANIVKDIVCDSAQVSLKLEIPYPSKGYHAQLIANIEQCLQAVGVTSVQVEIDTKVMARAVQPNVKLLANVKNVIAVASGKGGVGKSTTSVNLALALVAEGAQVGILDADIYGPSQPRMLGVTGRPDSADGKSMEPMMSHGLQSMSIGYLIDDETPMVWRGPMVTQALEQLLRETNWHELDYLVIDLPPGTGDTQLTLAQKIPVSGAVIVTTPQDIALLDARKGLKMFEKVDVSVLGIVENMSTHICSNCGHEEHIFGAGGGERMAKDYKVDFLGSLPLDMQIRVAVDDGVPTVVADPEGNIAQAYRDIARKVAAKLALKAKDYSSKFPNIVIENN